MKALSHLVPEGRPLPAKKRNAGLSEFATDRAIHGLLYPSAKCEIPFSHDLMAIYLYKSRGQTFGLGE
jgi:hypothetical protein